MSSKKELYRFVEGSTVWTYTSSDVDEVYESETYTSLPLGRSEVESKSELSKASLEVYFALNSEFARKWLVDFYDEIVSLTIFEKEDSEYSVAWKGRLVGVKPDKAKLVLAFESIFTSLRRTGLRARFQRSCRHSVYQKGCYLNKNAFAVSGNVSSVTNNVVIIPEAAGYDDNYFTYGILMDANGFMRFITGHTGSQITVFRTMNTLIDLYNAGTYGVTLYPGCDLSRTTCKDKFNNLNNYGGFDWIPTNNPFDTSIAS